MLKFKLNRSQGLLLAAAVVLTLGLRAVLTYHNTEANDDHVEPILLWMETGVYPSAMDCWECFQPPLPYAAVKGVATTLGISTYEGVFSVFKWINFALASGVLWAMLRLCLLLPLPFWMQLCTFLFWGLNPKLLGIGTQATNDLFVIFLGSMFFLQALTYLKRPGPLSFLLLVILAGLSCLSKASGIALVAIALGLLIYGLIKGQLRILSFILRLSSLGFMLLLVAEYGNYHKKYEQYGTPFQINIYPPNPANFHEPDTVYWGRAGVTSFTETYLSFQLPSLLKEPYNINSGDEYPLHRTSYFSQLYGQYSHILFERHPASWQSPNNDMLNMARINYILQLPLLVMFLFGLFKALGPLFRLRLHPPSLAAVFFLIYLLIGIRFSFVYRDFSTMKLLYLFPGVLAMQWIFQYGILQLAPVWQKRTYWLIGASSLLYVANIFYLIRALV